jgi:hypothetical protein
MVVLPVELAVNLLFQEGDLFSHVHLMVVDILYIASDIQEVSRRSDTLSQELELYRLVRVSIPLEGKSHVAVRQEDFKLLMFPEISMLLIEVNLSTSIDSRTQGVFLDAIDVSNLLLERVEMPHPAHWFYSLISILDAEKTADVDLLWEASRRLEWKHRLMNHDRFA